MRSAFRPHHDYSIVLLAFSLFLCRTTGEIRLMLSTLCVCEVGAIVLVYCQAKTAFEASYVILKEVGVLV